MQKNKLIFSAFDAYWVVPGVPGSKIRHPLMDILASLKISDMEIECYVYHDPPRNSALGQIFHKGSLYYTARIDTRGLTEAEITQTVQKHIGYWFGTLPFMDVFTALCAMEARTPQASASSSPLPQVDEA